MATACGYLAGIQSNQTSTQAAWLNIGIAGHKHVSIGSPLIVSKLTDSVTNRSYYPPLLLKVDCKTTELLCVDVPKTTYSESMAYDMECSAFYTSAQRFITSELVQVLKIVSDNSVADIENITEVKISQLIGDNVLLIDAIVTQLQALSSEYNSVYALTDEIQSLISQAQISKTQSIQLVALYRRFTALGGTGLTEKLSDKDLKSGKRLTAAVEAEISRL
jgi:hypothetical protein